MFRVSVLIALLSVCLLSGCGGDSNNAADDWNELDQELGDTATNGCDPTSDAYTDLRGQSSVTITASSPWVVPHNACIGIESGTEVTWEGDFDTHPLVGGVNGTEDSGSPITQEGASGTDPVRITFTATDSIEVEGYFCTSHPTTMGGVIAVFP